MASAARTLPSALGQRPEHGRFRRSATASPAVPESSSFADLALPFLKLDIEVSSNLAGRCLRGNLCSPLPAAAKYCKITKRYQASRPATASTARHRTHGQLASSRPPPRRDRPRAMGQLPRFMVSARLCSMFATSDCWATCSSTHSRTTFCSVRIWLTRLLTPRARSCTRVGWRHGAGGEAAIGWFAQPTGEIFERFISTTVPSNWRLT